MFSFSGKTVLVTGGTSGIGQAVALAFHQTGAEVIATGLPAPAEVPGGFRSVVLDVTKQAEIDAVLLSLPRLDVLVNAAGIIRRDDEFQTAVFEQVLDVNLTGTMRMCTGARPLLRESRGSIVNIASMLTFFGGPRVPAYSASKGAIAQLTKSLAVAWAGEGIRVNAVAPGWIATPLTSELQKDQTRSAGLLGRTPMARWGKPEEIAGPVIFLASAAASFMTGAIVPVDGGYSAA